MLNGSVHAKTVRLSEKRAEGETKVIYEKYGFLPSLLMTSTKRGYYTLAYLCVYMLVGERLRRKGVVAAEIPLRS